MRKASNTNKKSKKEGREASNNVYSIGERIAIKRKEKGYSQQQIADFVGVTRSLIGQIESNLSKPSLEFLSKFVSITGTTYNFLLEGDQMEVLSDSIETHELNSWYTKIVWLIELREKAFGQNPKYNEYINGLIKILEPYGINFDLSEGDKKKLIESFPKIKTSLIADFDELFHQYYLDILYSPVKGKEFIPPKNLIEV